MKDADAMKHTPITIAVASTKGGSGKSSITAALAVQAAKEGGRVAMLDWEPQGSLTLWWLMRGKPENPLLLQKLADGLSLVGDPDQAAEIYL
jgi:cellulose biosynthesis protein BcsQ